MDFLRDCMNDVQNPPLDVMQKVFCLKCANRQCDRAGMNQSAFDHRVKNWKSLLFDNVPRAEPGDPKYDNITSRRFLPVSPEPPRTTAVFSPGVPTIVKPSPPAREPTAFVRSPEPAPEGDGPQEGAIRQEEDPGPNQPPAAPPELEGPPPQPPAVPPAGEVVAPGNTAFQQGMILPGAPSAPNPAPSPDPEAPSPGKTFILEDD